MFFEWCSKKGYTKIMEIIRKKYNIVYKLFHLSNLKKYSTDVNFVINISKKYFELQMNEIFYPHSYEHDIAKNIRKWKDLLNI